MRRRLLLLVVAAALVAGALVVMTGARCTSRVPVVRRWAAQTAAAVVGLPDVVASRTEALAWTAAVQALAPRLGPADHLLPPLPGTVDEKVAGGAFAAGYMVVGSEVRSSVSTTTYTTLCYATNALLMLPVC
ncbi:MAG: hypothetical protein JWN17_2218, partial [Frankiales bacterium]|nr:hypothetical protein [Frankiales bacterium]